MSDSPAKEKSKKRTASKGRESPSRKSRKKSSHDDASRSKHSGKTSKTRSSTKYTSYTGTHHDHPHRSTSEKRETHKSSKSSKSSTKEKSTKTSSSSSSKIKVKKESTKMRSQKRTQKASAPTSINQTHEAPAQPPMSLLSQILLHQAQQMSRPFPALPRQTTQPAPTPAAPPQMLPQPHPQALKPRSRSQAPTQQPNSVPVPSQSAPVLQRRTPRPLLAQSPPAPLACQPQTVVQRPQRVPRQPHSFAPTQTAQTVSAPASSAPRVRSKSAGTPSQPQSSTKIPPPKPALTSTQIPPPPTPTSRHLATFFLNKSLNGAHIPLHSKAARKYGCPTDIPFCMDRSLVCQNERDRPHLQALQLSGSRMFRILPHLNHAFLILEQDSPSLVDLKECLTALLVIFWDSIQGIHQDMLKLVDKPPEAAIAQQMGALPQQPTTNLTRMQTSSQPPPSMRAPEPVFEFQPVTTSHLQQQLPQAHSGALYQRHNGAAGQMATSSAPKRQKLVTEQTFSPKSFPPTSMPRLISRETQTGVPTAEQSTQTNISLQSVEKIPQPKTDSTPPDPQPQVLLHNKGHVVLKGVLSSRFNGDNWKADVSHTWNQQFTQRKIVLPGPNRLVPSLSFQFKVYLNSLQKLSFPFLFLIHKMLSHKLLSPEQDFPTFRKIIEHHKSGDRVDEDGAREMLTRGLVGKKLENVNELMANIRLECTQESGGSVEYGRELSFARGQYLSRAAKEILNERSIPGPSEDLDFVPQYCALVCQNGRGPLLFGPYSIKSNRIIRQFGAEKFLRVSFEMIGVTSSKSFLSSFEDQLCNNGLSLCNNRYRLLSAPPSHFQKGKASCEFFAVSSATDEDTNDPEDLGDWHAIQMVQDFIGDRSNARTVFEFEARAGMSFSATTSTIPIHEPQIRMESDIKRNGYNFTDGCGKISPDLAEQICGVLRIETRGRDGGPNTCVFQVRLGEFKGMLVVDSSLQNTVVLRPSMRKFSIPIVVSNHRMLEILHTNPPHVGCATVNRQIIMLLSALAPKDAAGDSEIDKYLISILKDHLSALKLNHQKLHQPKDAHQIPKRQKVSKEESVIGPASSSSMQDASGSASTESDAEEEEETEWNEQSSLEIDYAPGAGTSFSALYKKCRFLVPDCWTIYGVTSEVAELSEGKVFVQINGKVLMGPVIVTKNPCIHPGDIRKLEAVDISSLHHLHNVIVFSVFGDRPPSNAISGSDLDGDVYFVSQNKVLTSICQQPPASYPPAPRAFPMPPFSSLYDHQRKISDHMANQIFNSRLGTLYNSHMSVSDQFGVGSPQALELAHLLSRLIDADKTGEIVRIDTKMFASRFPHFISNLETKFRSKNLLGKMHDLICQVMDECGVKEKEIFCFDGNESGFEVFPPRASTGRPQNVEHKETSWADRWKEHDKRQDVLLGKRKFAQTT